MAEGQEKICVVCKRDCSNRPRLKDRQGKYICQECFQKHEQRVAEQKRAKQREAEAAAAFPGLAGVEEPPIEASMPGGASVPAADRCPSCGAPLNTGAVICIACGYDVRSKRSRKVRVAKAETVGEEKRSQMPNFLAAPEFLGGVTFVVCLGAILSGLVSPEAGVAGIALSGFIVFGAQIYLMIDAIIQGQIVSGIAMFFCCPYAVIYALFMDAGPIAKYLFLASFAGYCIGLGTLYAVAPEVFDAMDAMKGSP